MMKAVQMQSYSKKLEGHSTMAYSNNKQTSSVNQNKCGWR